MLVEFDKLVQQREALMRWWKLGQTVAKYDGEVHKLRVDVAKPTMVAFCGQQCEGAQNYHYAPAGFANAVRAEMAANAADLTKQAYENELQRLNEGIETHREAVMQQLGIAGD